MVANVLLSKKAVYLWVRYLNMRQTSVFSLAATVTIFYIWM